MIRLALFPNYVTTVFKGTERVEFRPLFKARLEVNIPSCSCQEFSALIHQAQGYDFRGEVKKFKADCFPDSFALITHDNDRVMLEKVTAQVFSKALIFELVIKETEDKVLSVFTPPVGPRMFHMGSREGSFLHLCIESSVKHLQG